jgi:lipopolysaccharide biosynthesis glycosyltransferase
MTTVVLCFDEAYSNYAAVTTYTAQCKSSVNLTFYWICPKDCESVATQLRDLPSMRGVRINIVPIGDSITNRWKVSHHFSAANYLRLLIPEIVSEPKVLYLDSDTLVLSDLGELLSLNMGDNFIAGVVDPVGGQSSKVPRIQGDTYINSGVLLMDLDKLRSSNFFQECQMIYSKYQGEITWADQCILNKFAEGNKKIIDKKWNTQIFTQSTKSRDFETLLLSTDMAIMHFVGGVKPWQAWCNPDISNYWWKVAQEASIPTLTKTPITSIQQAITLANVIHHNERYEEASSIRDGIISGLLKHIREMNQAK